MTGEFLHVDGGQSAGPLIGSATKRRGCREYQEDDVTYGPSTSRDLANEVSLTPRGSPIFDSFYSTKDAGIGIGLVVTSRSIPRAAAAFRVQTVRTAHIFTLRFQCHRIPGSHLVFLTSADPSA